MGYSNKPLVSICSITYNHKNYISQAIEGFLMQKTNFPFEILIHDDASTDGTAEIIKQYQVKYPNLIKPIYQKENQFSKGIRPINKFNFIRAKGKYIALCEGDDYWTDPYKLQKQVDFLERNLEAVMCFCKTECFYDDESNKTYFYPNNLKSELITTENLLYMNSIMTCSVVFRNGLINEFPAWFYNVITGDHALFLILSKFGKILFINEVMCKYRIHKGGIWSQQSKKNIESNILNGIFLLKNIDNYFDCKYSKLIKGRISQQYSNLLEHYYAVGNIKSYKSVSDLFKRELFFYFLLDKFYKQYLHFKQFIKKLLTHKFDHA